MLYGIAETCTREQGRRDCYELVVWRKQGGTRGEKMLEKILKIIMKLLCIHKFCISVNNHTHVHHRAMSHTIHTYPTNSELYSLSKETFASVREWLTSFSRRPGSRYNINRRDNSSMKSAVVTALRFQLSLMAISISLACT